MGVRRTRVKFCGLVRPQDVDVAVALGVDAVGFVFYPKSARCVTLDEAAVLRRRLPSWVRAVGLFVNDPLEVMLAGVRRVGLDVVQAHGDETPQGLVGLGAQGVRYWKALRIGGQVADGQRAAWLQGGRVPADAQALCEALGLFGQAECCLLDSAGPGFGGTGHAFDWSLLEAGAGMMAGGAGMAVDGGLTAGGAGMAVDGGVTAGGAGMTMDGGVTAGQAGMTVNGDGGVPGAGAKGDAACASAVQADGATGGGAVPRLVLAGGLRPETVGEAIRRVGPFAVDVSSGIQGGDPRQKDTVRMERFMTAVLQADADRAWGV